MENQILMVREYSIIFSFTYANVDQEKLNVHDSYKNLFSKLFAKVSLALLMFSQFSEAVPVPQLNELQAETEFKEDFQFSISDERPTRTASKINLFGNVFAGHTEEYDVFYDCLNLTC